MVYKNFARRATEQDKRNVFAKCNVENLCSYGKKLPDFYIDFNPADVEIYYSGATVRFIPAEELSGFQAEYTHIKAELVFAVCNSDPIFLQDGKVYTCAHGDASPEFEKLAESFDDYLTKFAEGGE